MDRAPNFIERLKHNFPEVCDSVGMQAVDRDIKCMATECVDDNWRSVLDRLSGLAWDGITRIYFLRQNFDEARTCTVNYYYVLCQSLFLRKKS
jgi:hypothetical protein